MIGMGDGSFALQLTQHKRSTTMNPTEDIYMFGSNSGWRNGAVAVSPCAVKTEISP